LLAGVLRFKIGCQRSRSIRDQSEAERFLFCVNLNSNSKADRKRILAVAIPPQPRLVTPSWNPDAQSLAHQTLVLSVKTSHQMDASSLKKLTESETVLPWNKTEFFNVLKIKKGLLEMFFSNESLAI